MSVVLGISGGFIQRIENPAACLIINGKLVFAQEEERFNRIKNSRGLMPTYAIKESLKSNGLTIKDVDYVGINFNYPKLLKKLKSYFKFNFGYCPKIFFVDHHVSHAYSAYYPSGFRNANIITFDFSGDGTSTTLSVARKNKITKLKEFKKPNSLGIFYGLITQVLGFNIDNDEYKVMGLASFGKAKYNFNDILKINKHGYKLNTKIINEDELIKAKSLNITRQEPFFSNYLLKKLNIRQRMSKGNFTNKKLNIAASAQNQLNLAAENLFKIIHKKTKIENFCLAGGVSLNCSMNKHLSNLSFVKKLYIQPAASDAGGSIGAAFYVCRKFKEKIIVNNKFYLGNKFSNSHIKSVLKNNNIFKFAKKYNHKFIAKELAKSKIVAIFQGRHEFGPRALGNRSILANPKNKNMKKILNKKIKYREKFRPFAPVVLDKNVEKYFYIKKGIDYSSMTVNCNAKPYAKKNVPACVHIDNTSRVQILKFSENKKLGSILKEFGRITGEPILINTSFNLNKQPNVNTIEDAISTFYSSGIDHLILENYVLSK